MKKRKGNFIVLLLFGIIFLTSFICANPIDDSIHLNLQSVDGSGNILAGTFNYYFNFSKTADCNDIVFSHTKTLTTDTRGIISYYINNTGLNYSDQYYICIYRNGVLQSNERIGQTPYAFRARNVTSSGIEVNSNLNLGNYNFTTLGSLGIGTLNPTHTLNVLGTMNVTGSSVMGNVDFNKGWTNGGVSILGGVLFAQSLYVYNISSLNINNLNINGSLFPAFDNLFDLGNSSMRWRNIYSSGNIYSNGTLYINNGIDVALFNNTNLINSLNTTLNIQNLFNATASMIANLSISQSSSDNSSWNQSFANSLYAPNTTAGIQNLINSTGIYVSGVTGLSFFINYTLTTTTGNITNGTLNGYPAANNICSVEVAPGSHMCTINEILNSISKNISNQNFTATFRAGMGAPGYLVSANDCEGWTTSVSSALGSIWVGSKSHTNTYGAGGLVGCNALRAIACCK